MARIYVTEKQLDKIIELLEKDLSRSLEQGLINYLKRVRRDELEACDSDLDEIPF
jgi:hypothetical protein